MRTILFVCIFASTAAAATLDELRTAHEVTLAEMDLPLEEWDQRYLQELKKLEAQAQSAGDLEQMLLVRSEAEFLGGGVRPELPATASALKRMQSIYDRKATILQRERAAKLTRALRAYGRQLTTLQQTLTRSGAIDQALAVRTELDTVTAQLQDVGRAQAASRPPRRGTGRSAPTNRTPGKLVAHGNWNGNPVVIPESLVDLNFISVDADYGWIALTDDHKVANNGGNLTELKNVASIEAGHHGNFALLADGTVHSLNSSDEHKTPDDVENVKAIEGGIYLNIILFQNGTVHSFGTKAHPLPADVRTGVARIAAGRSIYGWRASGTFWGIDSHGNALPNAPEAMNDVLDMRADEGHDCFILRQNGDLVVWPHTGHGHLAKWKAPDETKNARQLRVNGGYVAVQRPNGSWFSFCSTEYPSMRRQAEAMNQWLGQQGPLKDLTIGHGGYLIGIK